MRIASGIDMDGHSYAVRVDTFDRLKAFILESVVESENYNCDSSDLVEKIKKCQTEEELLDDDLTDEYSDLGVFYGRDMFTTLYDPIEKKERIAKAIKDAEDQDLYEISEHLTSEIDLSTDE